MMDAIDALRDLSKAAGDMRPGHKYKSRTADGKGGWVYDYGDTEYKIAQPTKGLSRFSKFVVSEPEKVRDGTYKFSIDVGKVSGSRTAKGSIRVVVYPNKSMQVFGNDSMQWLQSDLTDAQQKKLLALVAKYEGVTGAGNKDLAKSAGDMRPGHKYKSRTADGKGGWVYTYEDGSGGNRAHTIPGRSEKDKAPPVHHFVPNLADKKDTSRTAPASQVTRTWAETYLHLDKKDPKLREKVDAVIRNAAIASTVTKEHDATFQAIKNDIAILSQNPVDVQGRVKTLESVLGKLTRKKHYADATQLQDISGFRVIHNTVADVRRTVAAIKDKYEVVTEDDYLEQPQGAYRSYHLIVRHAGLQKEIQVRTARQDVFANWAHESYKPHTPEQIAAMRDHEPHITEYSKSASTYYWAQDTGQPTNPPFAPPCTRTVKDAFGCLEFTL